MEDNQNLTLLTLNLFAIRALEGLQAVGEERDILREIRCRMEAEDQEEVVITAVKELKKSKVFGMVPGQWLALLQRQSLCSRNRTSSPDSDPLSQLQTRWPSWKMEDTRTGL